MSDLYQTIDEIKEKLRVRKDRTTQDLALGKALDWGDYKHRTGRIRGINDALTDIDILMKREEITDE